MLGLVGRTGSGKSSVARALARAGAVVIDADLVGHEITDRDPEVRAALIAEYGAGVYRENGELDRKAVADRVFADQAARGRLDRLVHPRLRERIVRRLGELRAAGHRGVVVVDAALLLDWGLERECDAVLAVTAPQEEQVARLSGARGWSAEEARARLAVQRAPQAFAAAADETIDNRGTPQELERAALAALARLTGRARESGRRQEG